MSQTSRRLDFLDVFFLWIMLLLVLTVFHYQTFKRLDALDAACGVVQVEEGGGP